MIRLAVFLGNPGREYERTRHNLPWLALAALDSCAGLRWQEKCKGTFALCTQGSETERRAYLLKPLTFMNLSGESVACFMRFFKISPAELLAVHDDVELPFAAVHLRLGGGLGGHNGLRSIVKHIGKDEFYRYRLGVGRPRRGELAAHVLSRFSPDEEALVDDYCRAAAGRIEALIGTEPAEQRETLIPG